MSDIITVAAEAARRAGEFLLDNFGKIGVIETKGDRNLATNLDREAEAMIIEAVKEHFPSHGIIAEETGSEGLTQEYLWIIDPLDGTHNYIRDINVYGVSIGIVHKQTDFVAGVIYMPQDRELYVGEKGNGAYKNGRRIMASSTNSLKDCSISFDSSIRYDPKNMLKVLDELAQQVFNIRMFGSSVRILSYVAEGKLDAAVEFHDRPWDFAGGVAIIEEAGGKLISLRGGALTYQTIGYIASNAPVFDRIKEIVFSTTLSADKR